MKQPKHLLRNLENYALCNILPVHAERHITERKAVLELTGWHIDLDKYHSTPTYRHLYFVRKTKTSQLEMAHIYPAHEWNHWTWRIGGDNMSPFDWQYGKAPTLLAGMFAADVTLAKTVMTTELIQGVKHNLYFSFTPNYYEVIGDIVKRTKSRYKIL